MSPATYKARRESLGLTQAQLAERLGIARETVARREAGHPRNPITPEAALAIDALNARPRKPRSRRTKRDAGT